MRIRSIGKVVARRELELDGRVQVRLELGTPRKIRGHSDFYCPFRISGLDRAQVNYACGVDPIQAIQLALEKAGVLLTFSTEAKAGRLTWLGRQGDYGLPLPRSARGRKP